MKTLIAIPCGDQCSTDFLRALLSLEMVGQVQITFAQGSLIYDARNKLTEIAMEGEFDRVLWLDSDMIFPSDTMKRLAAHLDEGKQMVTGVYSTRKQPLEPTIYRNISIKQEPGEKFATPKREVYTDWPKEGLFEVAACGFGCCMMTAALLRRILDEFGAGFTPVVGFGEDISFCLRVRELKEKIWCDPGFRLGHVGVAYYWPD